MMKYIIVAVLLVAAGYGMVEAWPLIAGPSLSIAVPSDNTSFPGGVVNIKGQAKRAAQLSLDGLSLLYDQEGNFSSTLTFPRGGSILTFVVTDRFGRSVSATRSIFVP